MDKDVKYHKDLAEEGRWAEMSFSLQMANIGSEIQRAIRWKEKGKKDREHRSAERVLELLDLTISEVQRESSRRELAQLRDVMTAFFYDESNNETLGEQINRYFYCFAQKAAKERRAKLS